MAEAKRHVSSTEFVMWAEHMSRNRRHPLEYYIAVLSSEVELFRKLFSETGSVSSNPTKFLIGPEYEPDKATVKPKKVRRKKTAKEVAKRVKGIFAALFGAQHLLEDKPDVPVQQQHSDHPPQS